MQNQLEAFVTEASEEQEAGIGLIIRGADIIEDEGDLVPSCFLTREQALKLAYALAELAHKIPQ